MSDKEKLEEIRKRKLEQMKEQAAQQKMAEQQKEALEQKKYQLMRKILDQEARQRLENIRMVKPQFAEQIEVQLIQLFKAGRISQMSDAKFKQLLQKLSNKKKKDFKIKKF
jgi:programmed cell death protein 5